MIDRRASIAQTPAGAVPRAAERRVGGSAPAAPANRRANANPPCIQRSWSGLRCWNCVRKRSHPTLRIRHVALDGLRSSARVCCGDVACDRKPTNARFRCLIEPDTPFAVHAGLERARECPARSRCRNARVPFFTLDAIEGGGAAKSHCGSRTIRNLSIASANLRCRRACIRHAAAKPRSHPAEWNRDNRHWWSGACLRCLVDVRGRYALILYQSLWKPACNQTDCRVSE